MNAGALFKAAGITLFERGWLSSNSILFDARGPAPTLVDTGYWRHASQLVQLVEHALEGRSLARVINTHLHSDHCGGNHALQTRFACSVDVPAGEAGTVDRWDTEQLTFEATGQACPRFERTGTIAAGDRLKLGQLMWELLAAPGHDANSIVLYQPALKLLVSADALWSNGFGIVFPELGAGDGFDRVAATLGSIAKLDIDCVIPGHGPAFFDAAAALDRARRRLDRFVERPELHARHAAKVLVKFHMLEWRRRPETELRAWAHAVPYLRLIHEKHFADQSLDEVLESVVAELCFAGHLRRYGGEIFDS